MTAIAFANGNVVTRHGTRSFARIEVEGEWIKSIDAEGDCSETINLDGGWLLPGFIDTQVNGGGGVLFNDHPTAEAIAAIGSTHVQYGTTGFLPTLISDKIEVVAQALDALDDAISAKVPGVLGVHLEGPILNAKRKGVHNDAVFRRLDSSLIDLLSRPRRGIVMVTLAPELCEPSDIATLARAGVLISAGHTDATYDEMTIAMDAGLVGITHLFNAMSPLHHRELGVVGAALESGRVYCGVIADGAHVHAGGLRIAVRAIPADRLMLVTDAMPSVGATSKDFVLQGRPVHVENGICIGPDGELAGSDLDMARAVRNMVMLAGATPEQAATMAAANPALFLGLSHERGALAHGLRADWVWLDRHLLPHATWLGGRRITSD